MKTIKTLMILFAATLVALISSCKDDNPIIVDDPFVSFEFSSPEGGATFGKGDTVFINGMISHTMDMHGYEVSIINNSHNDSVVYNEHSHNDGKMFHIHEHWVNSVEHHSNMTLKIEVLTDHAGNRETKEVLFHCHPM